LKSENPSLAERERLMAKRSSLKAAVSKKSLSGQMQQAACGAVHAENRGWEKKEPDAQETTRTDLWCEPFPMSDTEDYPGPSQSHPEKQGQDPRGRANEEMVKPTAPPKPVSAKKKVRRSKHNPRVGGRP
jgi:hypothetical protein